MVRRPRRRETSSGLWLYAGELEHLCERSLSLFGGQRGHALRDARLTAEAAEGDSVQVSLSLVLGHRATSVASRIRRAASDLYLLANKRLCSAFPHLRQRAEGGIERANSAGGELGADSARDEDGIHCKGSPSYEPDDLGLGGAPVPPGRPSIH
jgi:hypothetical protein